MTNQANIFDGLVTNERTYTELFRNMCRYQFFRDAFARFVRDHRSQDQSRATTALADFSFGFAHVETQYYSEDSGTYPDVIIDTGELRLVIEIKTNTWTEFQESQPDTYVADLKRHDDREQGLVVLIPRYHSHQESIIRKIDVHRKDRGDRPFILLLYWEDFIQRLEDAGARELNSVFRDYLDVSNDWFVNGRITLSSTHISVLQKPMGRTLFSLRALVEVIHSRFSHSAGIKLSRIRMTDYDFGFYISDADKTIGYFGIANYAWIYGPSPVLFGVHSEYVGNVGAQGLLPTEKEGGLHYWGLSRPLLTGPKVVETMTNLVASTFKVEQSGTGEAEDQVQVDQEAIDSLFGANDAPSAFQNLIRIVEQIGVAVLGSSNDTTAKKEVSRWEHSLYFLAGREEVAGVGIFFGDWKEKGLPLWVGVPESNQKALAKAGDHDLVVGDEYREPEDGGESAWVYRAIRLSDNKNLVESVLKVLRIIGLSTNVGA